MTAAIAALTLNARRVGAGGVVRQILAIILSNVYLLTFSKHYTANAN